jgi:uncharacterized protein HemX
LSSFSLNLETSQPHVDQVEGKRIPLSTEVGSNEEIDDTSAAALVLSCICLAMVIGLARVVFGGTKKMKATRKRSSDQEGCGITMPMPILRE